MSFQSLPLILVVDDDHALREVLADYFGARGYATRGLPDTQALEPVIRETQPAVVILDRMMPGEDGVSACRRLRARGIDVPIILLTAIDATIDRIVGLESGADDYLGKPFDPRELEARIATVLRRPRRMTHQSAARQSFGPFEFDLEVRVLLRAGTPVLLTPREAALLHLLIVHAREPLTREQLLEPAEAAMEHFDRAVDAAIYRLRRVIEDDPTRPRFIRTVRGVGYAFHPEIADPGS
jgi:two-component system phosphate regulon response regulator OmpR